METHHSSVVAVDALILIQHWDMQLGPANDPVIKDLLSVADWQITHHNGADWSQDDYIATEKSRQGLGGRLDLPRAGSPASKERSQESTSLDVDPSREKESKVV
jgi:hypothetical protein